MVDVWEDQLYSFLNQINSTNSRSFNYKKDKFVKLEGNSKYQRSQG